MHHYEVWHDGKGLPLTTKIKRISHLCRSNKCPNCDAGGLIRGHIFHIEQLFRLVSLLKILKLCCLVHLIVKGALHSLSVHT